MTLIRIVRTAAASQAMVTSKGITRVLFSKPVSRTAFDQRVLILVGVAMLEEKHMVPSPSKTSIAYRAILQLKSLTAIDKHQTPKATTERQYDHVSKGALC